MKIGWLLYNLMRALAILILLLSLGQLTSSWCLKTTVNLTNEVTIIDYSPDGTLIAATSSTNNAVYIYDTTNFLLQYTYNPPGGTTVQTARFTANNTYLGVGLSNGNVLIIPGKAPFSSTAAYTITTQNNKNVADLDFNAGGTQMVVCLSNWNSFFVITNYASATPTSSSLSIGSGANGCKFSLNNDVAIIDNSKNAFTYTIPANGNIGALNFISKVTNPGGGGAPAYVDLDIRRTTAVPIKIILSGGGTSQQSAYYFMNTGTGTTVTASTEAFINAPSNTVAGACYSPDNLEYAFASADTSLWVFSQATNTQTAYLTDSNNAYQNCAFSPNGQYLVAGTALNSGAAYIFVYTKTCFFCDPGYYQTGTTSCAVCTSVMTACAMCYNSTVCTGCFQGYFLYTNNNTCASCVSVMTACSTCNTSSTCIECDNGYYLSSGSCVGCWVTYPGCLACSASACLLCDLDYYLSGGNCVRCSATGCLRCTTSTACVECIDGMYLSGGSCAICNGICLTCYASATNCSSCMRGYYLSGNTCTACMTNCLQCTSSTVCLQCNMGYYVTGAGGCSICTNPCLTCSTSATTCLSCALGYYLSTNTCNSCTNNCSICTSSTYCLACSAGYYLTASNTCLSCATQYTGCSQCLLGTCLACDQTRYLASATACTLCNSLLPGCQVCSSSASCTICVVGYYLSGSTCVVCPSQCEVCSSVTACSSCAVGYWLSGSTCTACSAPCSTCTSATACLSCVPNYYISVTSCLACTGLTNCLDCLSSTYCIACLEGYYPNAGSCTSCSSNCLQCTSTNCLSCNLGYYLATATTCSSCPSACSVCSSAASCQSCDVGYYLSGIQCNSCTVLGAACLTCTPTACLSCLSGYYLNAAACSSCMLAVSYCNICSSSTVCTQCQDGYYLAAANSCLACGFLQGCLECSSATSCTICANGYYLSAGSCSPCSSNCSTCTSLTVCTTCTPSFYLSGSSCFACEDTLIGCQSCSTGSVCLGCGGGYLLSGSACQPCANTLPACSLCSNAGVCQTCQQGYFLNTLSSCQLCSSVPALTGCLICSSSTVCQYCNGGYYLSGGACQLCSPALPGCEQCSSATVCIDCGSGYYLNSGTNGCVMCQSALPGCVFCSSSSVCLECQGGYYLGGSVCTACAQAGCEICNASTPTNCITCSSGYYMSGLSCLLCPQVGCLQCSSSTCTLCQSGYYLSGGSCLLCSGTITGCSMCSSGTVCTQCESLFYLSGSSCVDCTAAMIGCSYCSGASNCLACDGGYYLTGGVCAPCSNLAGCLICSSSSVCLTCTTGYYLSTSVCATCVSAIPNCYQCYSSATCASCANGYQLTATGGCTTMQVSSGSAPPPTPPPELQFASYYVNATMLKHALLVTGGSTYQNVGSINWTAVAKIFLQNAAHSTLLTIYYTQLSPDSTALYFYTNNPMTINPVAIPVASAGRMLTGQSMQDPQLAASFALPQSVINTVLPSLITSGDISMSYSLDGGQFYTSYVLQNFQFNFYLFGVVVVGLLFVYGLARATCLPLMGRNVEIAGHLFALKAMPLVVFPVYAEYVNFSLGFMAVDLPWLNSKLPSFMYNTNDFMPAGYLFYFENMNFAAMHLFTCAILVGLLVFGYCFLVDAKEEQIRVQGKESIVPNHKFKAFKQFLLNYFCFGLVFAGFSSVIGAFLNSSSILTINGLFYIIGGMVFGVVLSQAFVNFWTYRKLNRIRVAVKATLLAGAGLNPLYLAATAILLDGILIAVEYHLRKKTLLCPVSWVASNIFALMSLTAYFFVPDSLLTLYLVMGLVGMVLLLEVYQFYCEKKLEPGEQQKVFEAYNTMHTESHFWNLQPEKGEEKDSMDKQSVKYPSDKQEKLIFNSFAHDEDMSKEAMTTSYSSKGFEPKRRTRKFKKEGVGLKSLQVSESTIGIWNNQAPTKDLPYIPEEQL